MMDKTDMVIISYTVCIQYLFAVGAWQIEEIWRSLQNGWAYNLPFGNLTYDYWGAHDLLYCIMAAAMISQAFLVVFAVWRRGRVA